MTTPIRGRFDGKTAVVTGAASGIGRSVALLLAAEGAQVVGLDINAEGLAQTLTDATGDLRVRECDVRSRAACFAAVEQAVADLGHLDILGNIAGVAWAEHFTEASEASYREMMGVNVDGYFFMAQAAIPHLLHDGGVIVNIASNAGLMGQAYTVAYCMTKGAVVQLTKALAMEYVKTPMRVVAIAPGGVDTGLTRGYQMPGDLDWELMGRYISPRGMAQPEDMSALFAFLASDAARSIHGAIVSSDFGMTAG